MSMKTASFGVLALAGLCVALPAPAQQRLKNEPGYPRYEKLRDEAPRLERSGALRVTWKEEGKAFEYEQGGKRFLYDIATRKAQELPAAPEAARPPAGAGAGASGRPQRGRQAASATSPDGKRKAFHRERNLWVSAADGSGEFPVTTDGNAASRVKYGIANWVYGEELAQTTAIWWAPDNRRVAFYRFDETGLADYHLTLDQTRIQSRLDVEPYMKTGTPNPVVDVLIYDIGSARTQRVQVRDGAFTDDSAGHYIYGVEWSPDGRELLFLRANRLQNRQELCAADPVTGAVRVVVREEWPTGWVDVNPHRKVLKDGRFIWRSERTGWKNFYLYARDGRLLRPLTVHAADVNTIEHVDEKRGVFYYTARTGDNYMKMQLHRAGLNGRGGKRLTDPAFNHGIQLAPDGRHFVDTFQTHDSPPAVRLMAADGERVADLASSDRSAFAGLNLKPVQLITFKAADGTTDLHGLLHYPANFDPAKKYPLIVSVYAGPETSGARETFMLPSPFTELGFFVASFDSRSSVGRGKRALDVLYGKFGQVEIDDQAAAVKSLGSRAYIDLKRVGIFGTSFGGTASAMCLLRYPEVFQAAAASSMVSDWRNYDTIYTERYMGLPKDNEAGYKASSVMTYADRLQGHLLIAYGTADNNTHPSNSLQLIQALQKAGKSFEVQVNPDQGHTSVNRERMMEFFIERLRPAGETPK